MFFVKRELRIIRSSTKLAKVLSALSFSFIAVMSFITTPALAVTTWTDWTSATVGGSASGSVGGVEVSYSGDLDSFVVNGTSAMWLPNSSFIGGTVNASPSAVGDYLGLNGNGTGTNTINFASPVVDRLIAIWSLGS